MSAFINTWTELMGSVFFSLALICATLEFATGGNSIKSAIVSPIMVIVLAITVFQFAKHFKYLA